MRKILLAIIILITVAVSAALTAHLLKTPPPLEPPMDYIPDTDYKKNPTLWCPEPLVDFGYIFRPVKKPVEHSFRIENTSSRPVKVKVASTSCTCSRARLTHNEIAPGSFTEFEIVWDVPGQPGPQFFDAYIEILPAGSGMIRLVGKILVKDCYIVEPYQISFGDIKPDETKTEKITVQASSGQVFPGNISFALQNPSPRELVIEIERKTDYLIVLDISVTGRSGLGPKDYALLVKTGDPVQPEIEIPIQARHLDLYEPRPAAIMLKKNQDNAKPQQVEIVSNTSQPAKIEKITVDKPDLLTAKIKENTDDKNRIDFFLSHAASQKEAHTGIIEVFVEGQDHPVIVRYLYLGGFDLD